MNDQIPADKVRKIVNDMRSHADHDAVRGREEEYVRHFADRLEALLPTPATLADMTEEDRAAYRWMQCDVKARRGQWVITDPCDEDGDVSAFSEEGEIGWFSPEDVTPRPDLPRLEWPGTEKPAPAPALPDGWRLADHPQYGPVVVTSMEPDDAGFVWFVRTDPYGGSEGYDAGCCKPDVLTFLAQGADTSATEGGGTSDTVPEGTLAVGSVWDDADALTRACAGFWRDQIVVADKRGMVGVWDTGMQCWRVSAPHADFAPYTVIHAGKKADQ